MCALQGHEYIVTDDKEGENSELEKHLQDANILISTPFHPAYLTKERIQKAKNLKLSITAGVGSDHVDLHAAADSGMTVAEVTGVLSQYYVQVELLAVCIVSSCTIHKLLALACCLPFHMYAIGSSGSGSRTNKLFLQGAMLSALQSM